MIARSYGRADGNTNAGKKETDRRGATTFGPFKKEFRFVSKMIRNGVG